MELFGLIRPDFAWRTFFCEEKEYATSAHSREYILYFLLNKRVKQECPTLWSQAF